MKLVEIDDCLRLYRQAVEAFALLEEKLAAARQAAEGLPAMRLTLRRLEAAAGDLERIGDGLAVLPELAEQLRAELSTSSTLREQAVRAGLILRYDE